MTENKKCLCACHDDSLKKGPEYEHDSECCDQMAGVVVIPRWEEQLSMFHSNFGVTVEFVKKLLADQKEEFDEAVLEKAAEAEWQVYQAFQKCPDCRLCGRHKI